MILCIEDSSADSTTLFSMLRFETDRALVFVPSQRQAIAALAKLNVPPVLILCDLIMADNGHATIEFLRGQYPDVPVVVVTAASDEADAARALAEGAWRVIQKGAGLSIRLGECLADLGLK